MDQLRMMEEAPYFGWIWRVSKTNDYLCTQPNEKMTLEDLKTSEFEKPWGEGNRNHFTVFRIAFWVHALWELPRKWKTSPRLYIPWTIWMLWLGCVHQRRQIPHGDLQLGGLDSDSWIDGTCKAGNVSSVMFDKFPRLAFCKTSMYLGVCLNPVTAWK